MPASDTAAAARGNENRFQSLTPASLSRTEKSSVIKLALAVLSARYRPGRAFTSPEDIEGFLRLKLAGRRNEVFGIVYLDTRHRLIEIAELFNGTVDGAAVYPRVVVQQALEKNAAAVVLFHNHPLGGKQVVNQPMIGSVLRKILGDDRMQLRQYLTA
ncbi:JAB domain-containing protein [Candidatus Rariloculus sp.]|uniref:JAB domain-containing protein n=1 Tax=Candidatus Rariloculus sp. TaxID=3101265 RepID=UPI003D0CD6D2